MVDYKPITLGMIVTAILGSIILQIPSLGFLAQSILSILAFIIGGFIAAYYTVGDYKDGGVNGAMAAGFGGVPLGILFFSSVMDNVFNIISGIIAGAVVGYLIGMNFGIIGAVMGNKIKRNTPIFFSRNNGYLVCNNCGGYYKLQEGESSEDFNDNCNCGGKLVYKKSIPSNKKFTFLNRVFGYGATTFLIGLIMLIIIFRMDLFYNWILRTISICLILLGIMYLWASIQESWEQ